MLVYVSFTIFFPLFRSSLFPYTFSLFFFFLCILHTLSSFVIIVLCRFSQAIVSIKISNILISFFSLDFLVLYLNFFVYYIILSYSLFQTYCIYNFDIYFVAVTFVYFSRRDTNRGRWPR